MERSNHYIFCGLAGVLCLLLSCSPSKDENEEITWDCRVSNTTDSVDIQSFFTHASILCLEETEKSRIGQIAKAAFADTLLFIMDNRLSRQIFVFNAETGKFLRTIGRVGHGPGEFVDITDMTVDVQKGYVYVLCEKERVCKYDFQGRYLEQKKISFFAEAVESVGDRFYFVCYRAGQGNVIIADREMNIIKSHLINDPDEPVVIGIHPLQKNKDGSLTFFRYLDNNIYVIDQDDNLPIRYRVDIGDNTFTREDARGNDIMQVLDMENNYRCNIKSFIENDVYASILFFDHGEPQMSFLNKKTGKVSTFSKEIMKDSALGYKSYLLEYAVGDAFVCEIGKKRIKEELVINKDCNYGLNPALYFLHCK